MLKGGIELARLPQPGGDKGTWGEILNEYLAVEHNSDGTLKSGGTIASYAPLSNPTFTGNVTVPAPTSASHAVTKAYADGLISSGVADATTLAKGKLQLAGDLAGTADSPQIAANVIVDADINSAANIAQSKIANLTSDLSAKETPVGAEAKITAHAGATDPHGDRNYVNNLLTAYAPLSNPTFTGAVTVPTPTNATDAATKQYVTDQLAGPELVAGSGIEISAPVGNISTLSVNEAELTTKVSKAGDTMTGNLTIDPSGDGVVEISAGAVRVYPTTAASGLSVGLGNYGGFPLLAFQGTDKNAALFAPADGRVGIFGGLDPVDPTDIVHKSYADSTGTHLLASTATPVTIVSSSDLHSYSVPADRLKVGDVIELTYSGTFKNNSGGNLDLGFRIYVADSVALVASATSVATSVNRRKWRAVVEIVVGPTLSAQATSGTFYLSTASTATWPVMQSTFAGSAVTALNQAATHTIKAYGTLSVTGAEIDVVLNSAIVKLHRA